MATDTTNNGNKGATIDSKHLLTNPSFVAFEKSGYGQIQKYVKGELSRLNDRVENYTSEIEALEAKKPELHKQALEEAKWGMYTSGIPAGSAMDKIGGIDKEIAELRKPFPLPNAETLKGIQNYAAKADMMLYQIDKNYLHQLKNWDKLDPEAKDFYFDKVEARHKAEYEQKREEYYDSFKPVVGYRAPKGAPAQMVFEDENGRQVTMISQKPKLPEYQPLVKDSPECEAYVKQIHAADKAEMDVMVSKVQQNIDLLRGVYPQGTMSSAQIETAMDDMWDGFITRTGINTVVGLAGMGASNVIMGSAGYKAFSAGASELTGKVLSGTALKYTANTGMIVGGLGVGILSETPMDMALSSIFENDGDFSLEGNGIQVKTPTPKELEDMAKEELYKDVDPLTHVAVFIGGYESTLLSAPALLLEGKEIPSLCVSHKDLEAGLKADSDVGKEIASRISKTKALEAIYENAEKKSNAVRDAEWKAKEQPKQEIKTDEKIAQQNSVPLSPTELQAQANNGLSASQTNSNNNNIVNR